MRLNTYEIRRLLGTLTRIEQEGETFSKGLSNLNDEALKKSLQRLRREGHKLQEDCAIIMVDANTPESEVDPTLGSCL